MSHVHAPSPNVEGPTVSRIPTSRKRTRAQLRTTTVDLTQEQLDQNLSATPRSAKKSRTFDDKPPSKSLRDEIFELASYKVELMTLFEDPFGFTTDPTLIDKVWKDCSTQVNQSSQEVLELDLETRSIIKKRQADVRAYLLRTCHTKLPLLFHEYNLSQRSDIEFLLTMDRFGCHPSGHQTNPPTLRYQSSVFFEATSIKFFSRPTERHMSPSFWQSFNGVYIAFLASCLQKALQDRLTEIEKLEVSSRQIKLTKNPTGSVFPTRNDYENHRPTLTLRLSPDLLISPCRGSSKNSKLDHIETSTNGQADRNSKPRHRTKGKEWSVTDAQKSFQRQKHI